ncbi:sensor histidine kinase [Paractinoplanes atraurantiacus]|uniref:histidine kinase n=1 Tax=Paractinoplanes atraurantiacus TaxID=1036182 RepID=A0A285JAS8_9ACTN|nr:histidine kinase [Actinoplanes atraurantiacus]SNY57342.1 Signal transduction histidine kinase [Actinoplanes atraurantiacus]
MVLRLVGTVAGGVLSGVAEGLFLLVAVVSGFRVGLHPYALRLAEFERRRLGVEPVRFDARRAFRFLAARLLPAFLGLLTVGMLLVGLVLAGIVVHAVAVGEMSVVGLLEQILFGSALLLLDLQAMASTVALDRRLLRTLLAAGTREELERRITELTVSRAGVIDAVDAERRRIERDLHDGLQQRLVALGMLLGRARRSPDRAAELLAQAHEDAQRAIDELREVAWRVYPSALEHGTLEDVLTMVAQRSPVPVRVTYDLVERPPRPIETVLYFVACEAITNTAKHAGATVITVRLSPGVRMVIGDDGAGGASLDGSGLRGLADRVAALDGRFELDSPPGGGTTIRVSLPCG